MAQELYLSWAYFFFKNFNSNTDQQINMNVETLKTILERIPDDYEIHYQDYRIQNNFTIDVDNKKLILK